MLRNSMIGRKSLKARPFIVLTSSPSSSLSCRERKPTAIIRKVGSMALKQTVRIWIFIVSLLAATGISFA